MVSYFRDIFGTHELFHEDAFASASISSKVVRLLRKTPDWEVLVSGHFAQDANSGDVEATIPIRDVRLPVVKSSPLHIRLKARANDWSSGKRYVDDKSLVIGADLLTPHAAVSADVSAADRSADVGFSVPCANGTIGALIRGSLSGALGLEAAYRVPYAGHEFAFKWDGASAYLSVLRAVSGAASIGILYTRPVCPSTAATLDITGEATSGASTVRGRIGGVGRWDLALRHAFSRDSAFVVAVSGGKASPLRVSVAFEFADTAL